MNNRPVIIIGAGGHAKVLIDALLINSVSILGMTDPNPDKTGNKISGISILGNDEVLRQYPPESVDLVNGVGATTSTARRKLIYDTFKDKGYTFARVIHPSVIIAANVRIAEGAQIMAGVVIHTGSSIGVNSVVNTRAVVDHDCVIGAHVHLAPGTVLSGNVHVADRVHIGTAAAVIQGIRIGAASVIGAGAVVVRDISPNVTAKGVPAR